MGAIALIALLTGRARTCLPALAACVIVLLLVDPPLAVSVGFALSVLATGGLVLLAPVWSGGAAAARLAARAGPTSLCVPLAAQLVTTPVIVAISGSVPVLGVLANLLVAPGRRRRADPRGGLRGRRTVVARAPPRLLAHARGGPARVDRVGRASAGGVARGGACRGRRRPAGVGAIVVRLLVATFLARRRRFRLVIAAVGAGATVVLVPVGAAGSGLAAARAGSSSPARSGRATRSCSRPANRASALSWTPVPTPASSIAAWIGWAS